MFTVTQSVRNDTGAPVALHPYVRVRPRLPAGDRGLPTFCTKVRSAVLDGKLNDPSYATVKADAAKNGGVAETMQTTGGWIGITDKYWLTAVIPDQASGADRRLPLWPVRHRAGPVSVRFHRYRPR